MENNNEEVYHIRNEACPRCKSKGNDRSGDNLGVFSDGHMHCWACGYYRPGNRSVRKSVTTPAKPVLLKLPEDCNTEYSEKALKWVNQYGFSKVELLRANSLWSDKGLYINKKGEYLHCDSMLIFPVWIGGELLGYNARYFGVNPLVPKWICKGKLKNVLHILPGAKTLVITEDIISAMKVQKVGHEVMPIYGMHAASKWKALKLLGYSKVFLWLDPNMYTEMIKQARQGSLEGLAVIPILSTKDPKEHSITEIKEYLKCI